MGGVGPRGFHAPPHLHGPSPTKAIGPHHRKTPKGGSSGRPCLHLSPGSPQGGARLGLTPFPSYFMSVIKYVKIKSLL